MCAQPQSHLLQKPSDAPRIGLDDQRVLVHDEQCLDAGLGGERPHQHGEKSNGYYE
jgi:hypothetical protein